MKEFIKKQLENNREKIFQIGRKLFDTPELGFKEFETSKIICSYLDSIGVPYEKDISITGVRVSFGNKTTKEGKKNYHIAVLADIDCVLAGPGNDKKPFHSCGHSIQTAILLNIINAFIARLPDGRPFYESLGGRISFIFTPAEEFIDLDYRKKLVSEGKIKFPSGKQDMIANGLFNDVDCVLSAHIMGIDEKNPDALFDINSTLTGFNQKNVYFTGKAAHVGVIPYLGRNALQAANLSLMAIQMLKDTFTPEMNAKVYPILKSGGTNANIICDFAEIETYVRGNTVEALKEINKRIDNAVQCCAKALDIECKIVDTKGYMPLNQSKEINSFIYKNMLSLTSDDKIIKDVCSGASGDIGDLSTFIPTIQFGFSGIKGIVHSANFEIVDEKHVYEDTAMVLCDSIIDIFNAKM